MILADTLFLSFSPLVLFACAVAMVVLRAGASRIFFDIVGTMQAEKLIKDSKANATIMEALYLDALAGIQEGFMELGAGFSAMMDDVIPIGKEIGEAARQFEKFVSTGEDIDELNAQVIEIGHAFGFSADQAFDASAKMAQLAGVLGRGSTATGTEVGMAFGMISGMSTEAAMQRMVNLQQQTGFMTKGVDENTGAIIRNNMIRENSFRIMDQLNSIENTSVATMSQLTFVMNQFAAQANLAGESIASMAAMAAVLVESGEEQGKAGRALRMIYARLGADTAGARKALEELNIAVVDAETGALRPLSDILVDLQPAYQNMTGEQKQNLAQTVAGNVHYTRLIKLLEGTSRMQDLHTEAMEGAFPAQEEINRLQETNLFNLEQMESKLKTVKGTLANELMPTMTESTKTQMVFFDTIAQAAHHDGPFLSLGSALSITTKGFFRLAEVMRSIVGPFAQQILSVMHLRIATETLHHVRRAMNKEDMFHNLTRKQQTQEIERQAGIVKNSLLPVTEEEFQDRRRLIETYEKQIRSIKKKNNLTDQEKARIQQLIRLKREHRMDISNATVATEEHALAMQAAGNATNLFSMGLGIAGTSLMAFGGSQRMIRTGMVLNTFAMIVQTAKLAASTLATTLDSIAKAKNTGVTMAQAAAAQVAAMSNTALGTAFVFSANGAKGLLASLGPISLVLLALGGIAHHIAGRFDDVNNTIDDTNNLFTDMAGTIDIVNTMSMDEIQASIDAADASINNIADSEDSLTKAILDGHEAEKKRFEDARKMKILQSDEAKNLALLMDEANELSDKQGRFFTAEGIVKTASPRKKAFKTLENEYGDLFKTLDEMGVDSSAALAEFNVGNLEGMANTVGEFTDNIGDSFSQAEDTMHSFNNAREELFFGFSSSNLTGDLIRQVQQQGVENLITNTEVIMTNNFNGMTVPEVADQILEEIESRANLSGISLSMSAA